MMYICVSNLAKRNLMKTRWLFVVSSFIILTLLGCAFGRKVPYENMNINLSYSGSKSIALSIYDQREMVVDGSQKPAFVGYTRSGVGIAYPMVTKSGKPFAEIILETISRSLSNEGYSVKIIPTSYKDSFVEIKRKLLDTFNDRLIILKINKLHSDFYSATMFYYDIDVDIFNNEGNVLVTRNFQKETAIGGSIWGTGNYKEYSQKYLANEIESWFNDKEIREILN